MPTEYSVDAEIEEAMVMMLADTAYPHFAPIREHEVKIKSCILVRTDNNDEDVPCKGDPTKVKKLSAVEKLFVKDTDYILIVNYSAWKEASTDQAQSAILHAGLMKIHVEPTDSGLKMAVRKPDVVLFSATLEQFGPTYSNQVIELKDIIVGCTKRLAREMKMEKQ